MTSDRLQARRKAIAAVTVAVMTCGATPSANHRVDAARAFGRQLDARFAVAARKACDERGVTGFCEIAEMSRESVTADIVHYRVLLRVGPGAFDVIAIHRLVRERKPGVPIRTRGNYFYLHGSAGHFTVSQSDDANLLAYLARGNVDVWGLDLRWVQVPRDRTEFGFMKDWTFGTQVADVLLATRFARHARRLTGQHDDRLNLGGSSLGASLVYAVANAETTVPDEERDVAGLNPIDTIYALPPGAGATRSLFCRFETTYRAALASGGYTLNSLAGIDAGTRAIANPDDLSPTSPLLTNREAALTLGDALTFAPALSYHTFSIVRDTSGRPIEGLFTRPQRIFENLADATPWRARATMADYFGVPCGQSDLPYDDHLAEITVPVFYVGFAGGFGKEGLHILQLLGSQEITANFIQFFPDNQATIDFGHADWQAGDEAQTLVWEPIRNWISIHDGRHRDKDINR